MLYLFSEKAKPQKNSIAEQTVLFCNVWSLSCKILKALAVTGLMILISLPSGSFADIYRYKDEDGKWHFTDVKSDIRYTLYIKEAKENPDAFIKKYDDIIKNAAQKFNVEPSLVKAVIKAESGFDHKAVSKKGAQGLMQLMPGTAEEMAVDDPYDPTQNIFGGSRYLSKLMERYNNKMDHALAAYNAGPDKVDQYKGVPPYKETRQFIERVMKYYSEFKAGK